MKHTICLFMAVAFCLCGCNGGNKLGLTTVVIDPGHGGKDPGAVSKDSKTYEKNVTLDVSKRLADKIRAEYPGVTVIMTRGENFVSLNERADKANKAGANLFISIHVNSAKSTSANGFSVHTMGQSSKKDTDLYEYNLNVCKRENSVILLEDDYTTKYQGFDPADPESYIFMQLMQNAYLEQSLNFSQIVHRHLKSEGPIQADRGLSQDPFYVLWKTSMPSVLVELGFLSNNEDLAVMRTESGRDKMARALFESFKEYKEIYDASVGDKETIIDRIKDDIKDVTSGKNGKADAKDAAVQEKAADDTLNKTDDGARDKPVAAVVPTAAGVETFGIQIMAVSKEIEPGSKAFLGYTPTVIQAGRVFKYIIGVSGDVEKVGSILPSVREKYPDAFVVKIVNGQSFVYKK